MKTEMMFAVLFMVLLVLIAWVIDVLNKEARVNDAEGCGEIVIIDRSSYDYREFGLHHPEFGPEVWLDKGGLPVVEEKISRAMVPWMTPYVYPGMPSAPAWRPQVIERPYQCVRQVGAPGTVFLVGLGVLLLGFGNLCRHSITKAL